MAEWETISAPAVASDGWETVGNVDRGTLATTPRIAQEAAYKGVAGLADSVLNAPNNLLNLGKAAVGTVAGAAGRPDLMPELTPNPDFARRGLQAAGLIDPNIQPQGFVQNGVDALVQGGVGGALTGGASVPRALAGAGMGALSGGATTATMEATGNPALAATAGMLPGLPGSMRNPVRDAQLKSQNSVKDETFAKAKEAGYVVPPSAIQGSWIGNRIEGIGGKAALNQEVALKNQPVTNKIAREEAGLAPDSPISEATLAAARDGMAAPYREVAAISPLAKAALDQLKQARADSKLEWNHYGRQGDPAALKRAIALDGKAQMYETAIDKIASRSGNPDLLSRLRDARVNLAKNYDVDRAINVGSGDVDAQVIGRMLDKGRPLSDGLETIGRFANAFPSSVREASKVPAPGVSKLEALASFGMGLGGHAVLPGMGEAAAMLPLMLPPAARALALSPVMQQSRSYAPGALSQAAAQTSPIVTAGTLAELYRRQHQGQ